MVVTSPVSSSSTLIRWGIGARMTIPFALGDVSAQLGPGPEPCQVGGGRALHGDQEHIPEAVAMEAALGVEPPKPGVRRGELGHSVLELVQQFLGCH
jgi:hypothetical protein